MGNAALVGIGVTVSLFCLSVTFAAGKLTARVDALEKAHADIQRMIDEIFRSLRRIERGIAHEADT